MHLRNSPSRVLIISKCGWGACTGIYERNTQNTCAGIGCPGMEELKDECLIIGKIRNPVDFGLEKKVGEGEVLISVPSGLIDKRGK